MDYGPRNAEYDIDLGPVMLSDYYHKEYFEIVKDVVGPNPIIGELTTSTNTLIQGKMDFDCNIAPPGSNCTGNAGLAKFQFMRGKTHRLRLINIRSESFIDASLLEDGKPVEWKVVAVDGADLPPTKVTQSPAQLQFTSGMIRDLGCVPSSSRMPISCRISRHA